MAKKANAAIIPNADGCFCKRLNYDKKKNRQDKRGFFRDFYNRFFILYSLFNTKRVGDAKPEKKKKKTKYHLGIQIFFHYTKSKARKDNINKQGNKKSGFRFFIFKNNRQVVDKKKQMKNNSHQMKNDIYSYT